jgi:formylmethanofuran dehydrogenase subunit E
MRRGRNGGFCLPLLISLPDRPVFLRGKRSRHKFGVFNIMTSIGPYSYEQYLQVIESFHGYPAPGLILGGFMVDLALKHVPKDILLDAISETPLCLPDAIQLLTPCTVGNGWLKIINLGRYALSLYEKYGGEGVRVYVDVAKLENWSEIKSWMFKLKPKAEQDSGLLLAQLKEAGGSICGLKHVRIKPQFMGKTKRGKIATCVLCGESYPFRDGVVCKGCQGEAPYDIGNSTKTSMLPDPPLRAVAADKAVGKHVFHDMTVIAPGESKGPAFVKGQSIQVGDLCRLQQMGRRTVYVAEENDFSSDWVHENEAALAFAKAMSGDGVSFDEPPREGRITLKAARDGLFLVDANLLERFNLIPGVMCASRRNYSVVTEGCQLAATRPIPLLIPREHFNSALNVLGDGPLFRIVPMKQARVGILVTGTEVFQGVIEDRFAPIITSKVEQYRCTVVGSTIVPDNREAIAQGLKELINLGADLIVTTAGLSVDPDDVTRQGLMDAGVTDVLYGAPIIPGAMTLLARLGNVSIMGVPACALYFKITGFELLLPWILAGLNITRRELAKLGHGAFCLGCKACTFPKCPFGG